MNRADWAMTNYLLETDGPAAMLAAVEPVLERAVTLDDGPYVVLGRGSLAWGHFMLGDVRSAARWGFASMLASYGLRDLAGTTIGLPIAALVALEFGLTEDAATIMGAFDALCERYGVRPPVGLAVLVNRMDPALRVAELLEPQVLAVALERGRRMTLDEAMELVVHIGDRIPPAEEAT
jgi:hypothetical protein